MLKRDKEANGKKSFLAQRWIVDPFAVLVGADLPFLEFLQRTLSFDGIP